MISLPKVLNHYFSERGFVGPITETFEKRKADVVNLLRGFEG
jgi:hypothetical protein